MKVINKTENKNDLFSRKEIVLEVENNVVPSFNEARELIIKEFKTKSELVRIRKIDSQFGSHLFKIIVDIYDSKDEFERVVKKTKQEIDAEKKVEEERLAAEKAATEAKKAEEEAKAAAEAPKKEAPTEENKEEVTDQNKSDQSSQESVTKEEEKKE